MFLPVVFPASTFASAIPIAASDVISRNVPSYTSDDCVGSSPASQANDDNYGTLWRSCNAEPSSGTPVTLTYDLSGISSTERQNVLLAWYADNSNGAYDHTINGSNAFNIAKDYTIQANAAGGGSVPGSGWVTLTTITGNIYHSRQHQVDLTGYNWIRISITASEGSALNMDVAMNMDIHDISAGVVDDWIFFGDSITQDGMQHTTNIGDTFSKQINSFNSTYFPIFESGGIGGLTSGEAASNIDTWLDLFPGKFVTLNYGTNDAISLVSGSTFYTNMSSMVEEILSRGMIPVIPKIPWGCTANLTSQVPVLNAQIDQLYQDYPEIIPGPDFYTYYNNNQSQISGDCIHPSSPDGYTAYRTEWVEEMETAAYTVPTLTVNLPAGSYSSSQTVTLTSSKAGKIYYTTDGSTPTTSSSQYSLALTLNSTTSLKAITLDQAGNQSDLVSASYIFGGGSSVSSSTTGSSSVSNDPPSCSSSAPSFVPDLFQIDTSSTAARLFFTTSQNNVSGYQISYGLYTSADMYGDNFDYPGKEWILSRQINNLSPNTTYYFKVRVANSCNAGRWSAIKRVTTKKSTAVFSSSNKVVEAFPENQNCEYTVQPGDSLWKIAQNKLGGGVNYLKLLGLNNNIIGTLQIGERIKIC